MEERNEEKVPFNSLPKAPVQVCLQSFALFVIPRISR